MSERNERLDPVPLNIPSNEIDPSGKSGNRQGTLEIMQSTPTSSRSTISSDDNNSHWNTGQEYNADRGTFDDICDAGKHFQLDHIDGKALEMKLLNETSQGSCEYSNTFDSKHLSTSSKFLDLFESEISRVSDCIAKQQERQEIAARALSSCSHSSIAEADFQIEAIITLEKFIQSNINTLLTVTQKATYSRQLHASCDTILQRELSASPWNIGVSPVQMMIYSDIYQTYRDSKETKKNVSEGDVVWKAPSSFERSTDKYWIEDNNMSELLFSNVREAPLLVYGWKGKLAKHPICENTQSNVESLWDALASKISSVYFDSAKMDLYKERIKRSEGAQLFRVRWYGEKPTGDEHLFLELKTHHEKWINTKSVKERVAIRERDMMKFLSQRKWTVKDAELMVVAAQPGLNDKKLLAASTLLFKMHEIVVKFDLRPVVRSTYSRLAFQPSQSNDLRLTVDRNVVLVDERSTPKENWSLPDDAIMNTGKIVTCPYAVFEVKLSGRETPVSIQNLVNSGKVLNATKFSKFLTGAAAFNHDQVQALPYWADFAAFKAIFDKETVSENTVIKNKFNLKESLRKRVKVHGTLESTDQCSLTEKTYYEDKTEKVRSWFPINRKKKSSKKVMAQKRVRVEPKSFFANERTFIQWVSAAFFLVTIAVLLLELGDANSTNMIISTCMVSFSLIILSYSMVVYYRRIELLSTGQAYGYIDKVGPLFLAGSVLVGVLILLFYLQNMTTPEADVEHSLVLSENSEQCFRHSLDANPMEFQASDLFLDDKRGLILIPAGSDIFAIDKYNEGLEKPRMLVNIPGADLEAITYTPSGRIFAVQEMKNSDSDSQLLELDWDETGPDGMLKLVHTWTINSKGAEGIAWVHDKRNDNKYLYIASDDSNNANDSKSDRGEIHVYNIPPRNNVMENSKKLKSERTLNRKLVNFGLEDSKIGSLQYFEGLLYVLHDNARLVRAWDINTGSKKFEFELPLVDGGFDKQWEGMTLERVENSRVRRLRGENYPSDSSLVLHLALDTPAQVWSIGVSQVESTGQIVLPTCASPFRH